MPFINNADSSQWPGMVTPRKGEWYTVKKGLQFSRPRNVKLSLEGNNLTIPAQEEFGQ